MQTKSNDINYRSKKVEEFWVSPLSPQRRARAAKRFSWTMRVAHMKIQKTQNFWLRDNACQSVTMIRKLLITGCAME
jgi:hypothetical protein